MISVMFLMKLYDQGVCGTVSYSFGCYSESSSKRGRYQGKKQGYKEDPFIYFTKDEPTWKPIK